MKNKNFTSFNTFPGDSSDFLSKRLVYDHEGTVTKATTEMNTEVNNIEQTILDTGKSAEEVTQEVRDKIADIATKADTEIAPSGTDRTGADVESFLSKLATAEQAALDEMDANMDTYEQVAAYVKKRSEVEARLVDSETLLEGLKVTKQLDVIQELNEESAGLKADAKALNELPIPEYLKEDKSPIVKEAEDLAKKYEDEVGEIRKAYTDKINEKDGLITKMDALVAKEGEVPRQEDMKILADHLLELSKLSEELKLYPDETDLSAKVQAKMEQLLKTNGTAWEKHEKALAADPNFKANLGKIDASLVKLEANLDAARKNMEKVKAMGSAATKEQRAGARGWLAGAEQTYHKKHGERIKLFADFDAGLKNTPLSKEEPEPVVPVVKEKEPGKAVKLSPEGETELGKLDKDETTMAIVDINNVPVTIEKDGDEYVIYTDVNYDLGIDEDIRGTKEEVLAKANEAVLKAAPAPVPEEAEEASGPKKVVSPPPAPEPPPGQPKKPGPEPQAMA